MKQILLVGSGHSHLEVLKALSISEVKSHRFTLISPEKETVYSGLIPRFMMGEILSHDLLIPSAQFAESKGVHFIQDTLVAFDSNQKMATFNSGRTLNFDILSVNIGGRTDTIETETPASTVYLRPLPNFLDSWQEVQRICNTCLRPQFVIVGGGPSAVEIATALRTHLFKNQAKGSEVHIVTKGSRLCEKYSERVSLSLLKALRMNNIKVHFNEPISKIYSHFIDLRSGEKLKFDKIFLALPTHPPQITDMPVDDTLMWKNNIFFAGSCSIMKNHPQLPSSGVTAVHQGRHLAINIKRLLRGLPAIPFSPKYFQLNILITGQNKARFIYNNMSFEGALALKIKNKIDLNYIKSFRL